MRDWIRKAAGEMQLVYLLITMALLMGFFVTNNALTGFVTVEQQLQYGQQLGMQFNESQTYLLSLEHPGELKSLKISGSMENKGTAKAYLEHNGTRWLVFDSSSSVELSSGITGFAVLNESLEDNSSNVASMANDENNDSINNNLNSAISNNSNETATNADNSTESNGSNATSPNAEKSISISLAYRLGSIYDENDDGIEARDGVVDFSVDGTGFNWAVNESKLCAVWETYSLENREGTQVCYGSGECCNLLGMQPSRDLWNEAFYSYYGQHGATENNIISAQVEYADYSLDIENPYSDIAYSEKANLSASFVSDTVEFSGKCEDTCSLAGLNESNYTIIVELNGTSITIESFNYTIAKEIELFDSPPVLLREIPNITIQKGGNYTINLNRHFEGAYGEQLNYSHFRPRNISVEINGSIAVIMPDSSFAGTRYMFFIANDSVSATVSNVFTVFVNDTEKAAESVKERKIGAEIGKPVRWTVNKSVEAGSVMNATIPTTALNVSVNKISNGVKTKVHENNVRIIEGDIIKDTETFKKDRKDEEDSRKARLLEEIKESKGRARIDNEEISHKEADSRIKTLKGEDKKKTEAKTWNETTIEVNDSVILEDADEIEFEYYTEAPIALEDDIGRGKRIKITSETHYENILAYSSIPETKKESIRLYWVVNGTRQLFEDVEYLDNNSNGLIDKIEWIVPHLSNQTFEIIFITKAEHLNGSREFVEDIYEYVSARDGNWSPAIPAGHYVRVVFEHNLTNGRDITLYARSNYSNASIIVYEFNESSLIAQFENIAEDRKYKVFLDGLGNKTQDRFDLLAYGQNGTWIEFDYIVDPTNAPSLLLNSPDNAAAVSTNYTILNASAQDIDNDALDIFIYGANSTSTLSNGDNALLAIVKNAQNTAGAYNLTYNFTASVIVPDVDTVVLLHFDNLSTKVENGSLAYDFSGYGNNGTCNGNSCPLFNWSAGKFAGAAVFDGSNDYIEVNDSNKLDLNGSFTLEAWVNIKNLTKSKNRIVSKGMVNGTRPRINVSTFDVTFNGIDTSDRSGEDVGSGDLNNDGIDDLIIGAANAEPTGGNGQGETYIFYGPFNSSVSYVLSTANVTFYGLHTGDLSGDGVGSGDFNHDGADDLIVGAASAEPTGKETADERQGEAYIIYGPINASGRFNLSTANVTFFGDKRVDNAGTGTGSGDFNNDGVDDVIIGSIGADASGGSNEGKSHIIYGPINASGRFNLSTANVTFIGRDTGDGSGTGTGSGDFNNDGIDDVIIGAYAAEPAVGGSDDHGEYYVIYGPINASGVFDLETANVTFFGKRDNDGAGTDADSGDFNHDGIDDILIAAYQAEPLGTPNALGSQGEVYILFGPANASGRFNLSTANVTFFGKISTDGAGTGAGSGDFNNDGIDDVIIGANIAGIGGFIKGESYLLFGPQQLKENYNLMVSEKGAAVLSFQNVTGDFISVKTTDSLITEKEYHHIAGTVDAANGVMKIYVDGIERASRNFAGNALLNNATLNVGAFHNGAGSSLNGSIDELAIWNRSLAANEILRQTYPYDGTWYWKANATDSTLTAQNGTYQFTTGPAPDTTKPRINASVNNTLYLTGTSINLTANVSDETSLSSCDFIQNQSGSIVTITKTVSGTSDKCSQNFTISAPAGTVINYTVRVNDTSGNVNQSELIVRVKAGVAVSNCSTLSSANTIYRLTKTANSGTTCFTVQAHNVTIDCMGNTINYSTSSSGYAVTASWYNDLSIRNCRIYQKNRIDNGEAVRIGGNVWGLSIYNNTIETYGRWAYGINFASFIFNSTISQNNITTYGLDANPLILTGKNITIANNTIFSNESTAIYLQIFNASWIYGNNITVENTIKNGIDINSNSFNNLIRNNRINSTGSAVYLGSNVRHNTIHSNAIYTQNRDNAYGIYSASGSYGTKAYNNSIKTVGSWAYGVYLVSTFNVTVHSNLINATGSSADGIFALTSANLSIYKNRIISANGNSVYFDTVNTSSLYRNNLSATGSAKIGLKLVQNDYNNRIYGNRINSTSYGIQIAADSKYNRIYSNIVSTTEDNGEGIYSAASTYATIAYNNTVFTKGSWAYGMHFDKSSNCTAYRNNITTSGSTAYGLYLTTLRNCTIYNNTVFTGGTSAYGMSFDTVNDTHARRNMIMTNDSSAHGFYMTASHGNSIYWNNITTNGTNSHALLMQISAYNNTVYDNTIRAINNTGAAVYLNSDVHNNTFFRNTIISKYRGIYISGNGASNRATFNTFTNDTIKKCTSGCASPYYDILLEDYAIETVLLNVSFNKSRADMSTLSNMTVKWYLDMNVTDSASGNAISGAAVTVNDVNLNSVFSGTTDSLGYIHTQITDYVQNGTASFAGQDSCTNVADTEIVCYNEHSITVTKSGYSSASATVDMNRSKYRTYSLGLVPSIRLNAPANASSTANAYALVNISAIHASNSALTIYVWGANDTAILNAGNNALLTIVKNAQNTAGGYNLTYNWTAPVVVPDVDTVVLLHFDNLSGKGENGSLVYDFSAQGNNGTCNGNSCPLFNWSAGKFAGAAVFDGKDDYIEVNDSNKIDLDGSFTLEAWVNVRNLSKSKSRIVSKGIVNGSRATKSLSTYNAVFIGSYNNDNAGVGIAAGDFNNDGINDLIVGAHTAEPTGGSDQGKSYIFYGPINSSRSFNLSSANVTFFGMISGDNAGTDIGSGDLNNDGIEDIIIGAYSALSAFGYGEVYVIYGPTNGSGIFNISSVKNITLFGPYSSDFLGSGVSSGDFNNDGKDDLIVGAYFGDSGAGSNQGNSYIIYGPLNASGTFNASEISNVTFNGIGDNDLSGYAISSGDLNNDGIDDVMIGAPNSEPAGGNNQGEAYIIYGPTPNSATISLSNANVTFYGNDVNSRASITSSGDFNNDGIDDAVIGAYSDTGSKGKVYIVYGPINSTGMFNLSLTVNITYQGISAGESAGRGNNLNDVNNDGIDDLIVGAAAAGSSKGNIYVLFGPQQLKENYNLMVSEKGAAVLSFQNVTGDFISVKTTDSLITEKEYHHIAGTVDAANGVMKIYVDGIERASRNFAGNALLNNATLSVGAFHNGAGSNINGSVDDLAIWNRSLAANEITGRTALNAVKWYWKANASDGTLTAQNGTYQFTASTPQASNSNPIIKLNISSGLSVDPVAGGIARISISFNVTDADGTSEINVTTVIVNLTLGGGGGQFRYNASGYNGGLGTCYNHTEVSKVVINCTVLMRYYDNASNNWRINVSIRDTNGAVGYNDSRTFTYNTLSAIAFPRAWINFSSLTLGTNNQQALLPLVLNNTGNDDFNQINISAATLFGVDVTSESIAASQFRINGTNNGAGNGMPLTNGALTIRGLTGNLSLYHGHTSALTSYYDTIISAKGNQSLYFWVDVPSSGISSQKYNNTWNITVINLP